VKDEEASRPAQAYDLGGVSKWFFGVHIHSLYPRAYLSGVYAVVSDRQEIRISSCGQKGAPPKADHGEKKIARLPVKDKIFLL
jgi:hypothetical protein